MLLPPTKKGMVGGGTLSTAERDDANGEPLLFALLLLCQSPPAVSEELGVNVSCGEQVVAVVVFLESIAIEELLFRVFIPIGDGSV